MVEHRLTVISAAHPDHRPHPNAFTATLNGMWLCTSETPLLDAARELLKRDVLIMRHVGADHDALRARVGTAAKLVRCEPKGSGRLRLQKALDLTTVWPRIAQNDSEAPE